MAVTSDQIKAEIVKLMTFFVIHIHDPELKRKYLTMYTAKTAWKRVSRKENAEGKLVRGFICNRGPGYVTVVEDVADGSLRIGIEKRPGIDDFPKDVLLAAKDAVAGRPVVNMDDCMKAVEEIRELDQIKAIGKKAVKPVKTDDTPKPEGYGAFA